MYKNTPAIIKTDMEQQWHAWKELQGQTWITRTKFGLQGQTWITRTKFGLQGQNFDYKDNLGLQGQT